jgi:outer membrane biosynthesis protein TonB
MPSPGARCRSNFHMYRAFLIVALLLPVGACASAQAKAPVEPVALEVPPVPPRLIDPAPVEPPPIPPVEDLTVPTPSPAPTKPRPQARDTTRAEPKTEAKPDVVEPEAAPPAPVAPLRTGPLANGPEADRQIRDTLGRANKLLEGVDVRLLSEDRRATYDSAKDSIRRADEALKASNVVLARSWAERAMNFAELLRRQNPD